MDVSTSNEMTSCQFKAFWTWIWVICLQWIHEKWLNMSPFDLLLDDPIWTRFPNYFERLYLLYLIKYLWKSQKSRGWMEVHYHREFMATHYFWNQYWQITIISNLTSLMIRAHFVRDIFLKLTCEEDSWLSWLFDI